MALKRYPIWHLKFESISIIYYTMYYILCTIYYKLCIIYIYIYIYTYKYTYVFCIFVNFLTLNKLLSKLNIASITPAITVIKVTFSKSPHSCGLLFKHFIFLNLSYLSLIHPYIPRYGNFLNLNALHAPSNNIWSLSFRLDIALHY